MRYNPDTQTFIYGKGDSPNEVASFIRGKPISKVLFLGVDSDYGRQEDGGIAEEVEGEIVESHRIEVQGANWFFFKRDSEIRTIMAEKAIVEFDFYKALLEAVQRKQLSEVSFVKSAFIPVAVLNGMEEALAGHQDFRSLTFAGILTYRESTNSHEQGFPDADFASVPRILSTSYLSELDLRFNELSGEQFRMLFEAVAKNHHLTFLDIGLNPMYEAAANALGEALKVNDTLQTLKMNKTFPNGDDNIRPIFAALGFNNSLIALECESNNVGLDMVQVLVGALATREMPLRSLDLNCNLLGPDSLIAIAEVASKKRGPVDLELSQMMLPEDREGDFANALSRFFSLSKLEVGMDGSDTVRVCGMINEMQATARGEIWHTESISVPLPIYTQIVGDPAQGVEGNTGVSYAIMDGVVSYFEMYAGIIGRSMMAQQVDVQEVFDHWVLSNPKRFAKIIDERLYGFDPDRYPGENLASIVENHRTVINLGHPAIFDDLLPDGFKISFGQIQSDLDVARVSFDPEKAVEVDALGQG